MTVAVLGGFVHDTSVTGSRVSNANDLPRTRVFAMPDFRFPDRSSDRRAEAAASLLFLNAWFDGEGI
ncbi:hypothetical protein [Paraburkholderia aromaticivorans]|uniref:hypothetical protein n=1 Tax=Paraburkholderia aromaticivorans TaxID=2026199 RepID=UPI001455E699|nr:hypothetical protein [Paraburkholderia aromaticivorans]